MSTMLHELAYEHEFEGIPESEAEAELSWLLTRVHQAAARRLVGHHDDFEEYAQPWTVLGLVPQNHGGELLGRRSTIAAAAPAIDVDRAVRLNRQYARSLGWGAYYDRIARLLGFTTFTPAEGSFATGVARWQQRQSGLKVDGILGPLTWARMQPALGLRPTPQPSGGGGARVLCAPPSGMSEAERTALAVTTRFETGVPYSCVVSSPQDPDGISMGMLQWNLRANTLQDMLNRFEMRTGRLREFFGADTEQLKRLIALRGAQAVAMAKAEGLNARWRGTLLRLCADPQFCALLWGDIRARMGLSRNVAKRLGLQTVRGLSMIFDIQNGDGLSPGKQNAFAARLAAREGALGRPLTEQEKLLELADEAARFAGRWSAERRARRMLIANGTGCYRGSCNWNLDRDFPTLNDPWNR